MQEAPADSLALLFSKTRMSPGARAKVVRMCDYCETSDVTEVPDPYYGGEEGFGIVSDMREDACANLLKKR